MKESIFKIGKKKTPKNIPPSQLVIWQFTNGDYAWRVRANNGHILCARYGYVSEEHVKDVLKKITATVQPSLVNRLGNLIYNRRLRIVRQPVPYLKRHTHRTKYKACIYYGWGKDRYEVFDTPKEHNNKYHALENIQTIAKYIRWAGF